MPSWRKWCMTKTTFFEQAVREKDLKLEQVIREKDTRLEQTIQEKDSARELALKDQRLQFQEIIDENDALILRQQQQIEKYQQSISCARLCCC